jgi:carboxyl-terminal processing protease
MSAQARMLQPGLIGFHSQWSCKAQVRSAIMKTRQAVQTSKEDSRKDHTLLPANYHWKNLKFLNILSIALICAHSVQPAAAETITKTPPADPLARLACNAKFNETVLAAVDKYVRRSLYSKELSTNVWPQALEKQKANILAAGNLIELSAAINSAIDELKSSHCRFLTINDDTYYFLDSLFSHNSKKGSAKGECVFPGFVTGGVGYEADRVRFVLNDSPAEKAHIQVGDKILAVNGSKYIGLANFFDLENKPVQVSLLRANENLSVSLKVPKKQMYDLYVDAVTKSVRRYSVDGMTLGYVHLWCGGAEAQEAMANVLFQRTLMDCDGLILDLRDGYGACSPDALDPFFRQKDAYPDFETINREGKKRSSSLIYSKPMVAITNGGSRSGKEQLAFSLKKTKRALVIGDRTAGYFLAGSVQPINEKSFLYLAVLDCSLSGVRLEGTGVEPDICVQNDKTTSADNQLERAKIELVKRIKEAKSSS